MIYSCFIHASPIAFRQLRGIDKKIAALEAELNYTTGDREGCCRSLKALKEEKMRISRLSGSAGAGTQFTSCFRLTKVHILTQGTRQ